MILAKFIKLETFIGTILITGDDSGIHEILLGDEVMVMDPMQELKEETAIYAEMKRAREYLQQYFKGKWQQWTLIPDGTDFQKAVWSTAASIPFGKTLTYNDIALIIDKPGSARAVGNALGLNPLPILIPCHRVIASSGDLGGFSAGVEIKRMLLNFEARTVTRE